MEKVVLSVWGLALGSCFLETAREHCPGSHAIKANASGSASSSQFPSFNTSWTTWSAMKPTVSGRASASFEDRPGLHGKARSEW